MANQRRVRIRRALLARVDQRDGLIQLLLLTTQDSCEIPPNLEVEVHFSNAIGQETCREVDRNRGKGWTTLWLQPVPAGVESLCLALIRRRDRADQPVQDDSVDQLILKASSVTVPLIKRGSGAFSSEDLEEGN